MLPLFFYVSLCLFNYFQIICFVVHIMCIIIISTFIYAYFPIMVSKTETQKDDEPSPT